jgi:hypothetical protein
MRPELCHAAPACDVVLQQRWDRAEPGRVRALLLEVLRRVTTHTAREAAHAVRAQLDQFDAAAHLRGGARARSARRRALRRIARQVWQLAHGEAPP